MKKILLLFLVLLALAGCGAASAAGPRALPLPAPSHPPAPKKSPASGPVACGLTSCSHGKVGQACTIAGTAGIIVVVNDSGGLGCDVDGPVTPPPGTVQPTAPPPSQPAPVGSATLTSTCTTGLTDNGQFLPLTDNQGISQAASNFDTVADAYQVTLANTSQVTANITGFAVVLYGSGGNELTSDQETAAQTFLTPGQSLTWTESPWSGWTLGATPPDASVGPYAVGQAGAYDQGATCSLLQWYTGQ